VVVLCPQLPQLSLSKLTGGVINAVWNWEVVVVVVIIQDSTNSVVNCLVWFGFV
jgi:hypothetical protein